MEIKFGTRLKKLLIAKIDSVYMVMFLRTFALTLVVVLVFLISTNWTANKSLIASLGILVSALLASFSVVFSIDTNIEIKNRKLSNQIRYVFFHLCQVKILLIGLQKEKEKQKITYPDLDRILDTIHEINEMLLGINRKETISVLHNDILSDLHFLFLEIHTYNTFCKSLASNIIRPEPQKDNNPILPNPLNSISFEFEKSIEKLSRILTYLKEGYYKDFPNSGGIEMCAEYTPLGQPPR